MKMVLFLWQQKMSDPSPIPTYFFDLELDHILTFLFGLDLTGPDNLNVEIFQHQGITSFHNFKVLHPRDFKNWSYLIPSDSISDRQPVPVCIHEDIVDVIYFFQHLTATNHADRDIPVNWAHAKFGLDSDVIFIHDDDNTASPQTTIVASVIDQELDQVLSLILGLKLNNDDSPITNDDDNAPLTTSAATTAASNNNNASAATTESRGFD